MSSAKETFPVRFGDFALLSSLGVGGMGQAYLAAHPDWPGLVVLKRMHAHFQNDAQAFRRFLHEAKAATYVRHPAVAGAIAVGTVGKEPFFATEYVFGLPLAVLVERMESGRMQRPPYGVALYLALDLVKGLEAIHEAVDHDTGTPLELIHRDIGSRNVMVGFDGRLRIIDLGLGRSLLADWETAADTVAGSPDYMPPEQATGERVDRRADIYSAAVTIFEIFAGKKRIRAEGVAERLQRAITAQPETMSHHRSEASAEFDRAMISAMAPSPEARTRHASMLRRALEVELSKLGERPRRAWVVDWLEGGTQDELDRLKVLRLQAERVAGQLLSGPREETRVHAVASSWGPPLEEAFEHETEAATLPRAVAPSVSPKTPRRALVALGLIACVAAAVLAVVSYERAAPQFEPAFEPSPPGLEVEETRLGVAAAPDESPQDEVLVDDPAQAPTDDLPSPPQARPAPKPLAPALNARKRGLTSRLQTLRRSRFDVAYQRQLTQIGQGLSRARSAVELDEVERRIKKLEADR